MIKQIGTILIAFVGADFQNTKLSGIKWGVCHVGYKTTIKIKNYFIHLQFYRSKIRKSIIKMRKKH